MFKFRKNRVVSFLWNTLHCRLGIILVWWQRLQRWTHISSHHYHTLVDNYMIAKWIAMLKRAGYDSQSYQWCSMSLWYANFASIYGDRNKHLKTWTSSYAVGVELFVCKEPLVLCTWQRYTFHTYAEYYTRVLNSWERLNFIIKISAVYQKSYHMTVNLY